MDFIEFETRSSNGRLRSDAVEWCAAVGSIAASCRHDHRGLAGYGTEATPSGKAGDATSPREKCDAMKRQNARFKGEHFVI
jgi:hypothetical protein